MLSRAVFILITVFWLTMNALLWHAEFSSLDARSSPVALESVWERILTSPDSSSLSVVWRGRRVGYCHCVTSAGEAWESMTGSTLPSGRPKKRHAYQLQVEGSIIIPGWTNRVRFDGTLKVDIHREWDELDASVKTRPVSWHIHSIAREKTVQLSGDVGGARLEHTFRFSELRNPETLVSACLDSFAGEWAGERDMLSATVPTLESLGVGARWDASEGTFQIGRTQARVYQVQTQLLDRYRILILVSRVGEILRVELPGDWTLVNDQLMVP
jgi:hypothetical protein